MYSVKYFVLLLLISLSSQISFGQKTYYLDFTDGNDSNTGLSSSAALKTIDQLNTIDLQANDSVLFKRGEHWRNQLHPKSGDSTGVIYYGAYGEGALPLLSTSYNLNQDSSWIQESASVWLCTQKFPTDIGNIIFDNEKSTGLKKWRINDLNLQDDFYYNIATGELRLFSILNPAKQHTVIECALKYNIIQLSNVSHVVIENLSLKYSAAHGVGGTNTFFTTIRNCEISWIGGGDLNMNGSTIRYGNGIEFWCNAHDNIVENNKIWEIFDTGVTNQCHSGSVQKNIIYRNNVIWNCGMAALEIWNRPETSITEHIYFENNTCANLGFGWSTTQRDDNLATGFAEFTNESAAKDIYIRNNIFYNPARFFFVYQSDSFFTNLHIDHNCYYSESITDTFHVNYESQNYRLNDQFPSYQEETGHDNNSFFQSPNFKDLANNDYRLNETSPCIDAAFNTGLLVDHDHAIRSNFKGMDIGAYEFYQITSFNELVNSSYKVYPNPFKVSFEIRLTTTNKAHVDVFTANGILIESREFQGSISLGNNFDIGVYFVKMTMNDGKTIVNKVVKSQH